MKKLIAAATATAFAAGALAVPTLGAATKTVTIKDNLFSPKSMTVSAGTKVKWVWKGKAPHNVKVTKGPQKFASSVKTSGTFTKTLKKKGTYTIVCTIHAPSMKMTIKVK